jgi:Ca2+-binding RTX toxin-like protein
VRAAAVLGLLVLATLVWGLAAANTVPASRAGESVRTIGPNDLKPSTCSGITLTATVVGSTGTGASELLIGGPVADTMLAMGGEDCVLGGGGIDVVDGGAGVDVCIGGPGLDTFLGCETGVQD